MKIVLSKSPSFLLRGMIFIALFISGIDSSVAEEAKRQPNVIVVITDDQGYGDLSCHGNPWLKTPEIDKLHKNSVRLTDFHVDPTCSPTRAAFMSGRYSTRTGVWLTYGSRHHLRRDEVTVADVFKSNGYKTGIFGKWHLGDNYPFRPNDRGFDEAFIHGGGVIGETPDYWDNNYYDDHYFRNGKPEQVKGYCTDVWFKEAIKFIKNNKEKPFFLYISTNAPHGPLHVPERYSAPYKDQGPKRAAFYGMIANIDENIGHLQNSLQELSLEDDTILIFFNDNGTAAGFKYKKPKPGNKTLQKTVGYNAGMRGRKSSPYEGGHRAACFIRWPNGNLQGGRDVHGLTAHFDLLPTFMDLCELKFKRHKRFDGISLAPYLKNPETKVPERTLFVHHQGRFGQELGAGKLIKNKSYAVMRGPWRLVGEELYNIESDPGQRNNLSVKHPKLAKELRANYESWWTEISANAHEFCPFVINPKHQREVCISSQNLLGGQSAFSQRHVREAKNAGKWTLIDVEEAGPYRISIARWPREAKLALSAAPKPYSMKPETHEMLEINDRALDLTKAHLKIGDLIIETKIVTATDTEVSFDVNLTKGRHQFMTWFTDGNEKMITAYYAYIEPLG